MVIATTMQGGYGARHPVWVGMPFQRFDDIATPVDAILERGERRDIFALIAFLAGRLAIAKVRAREIRSDPVAARSLTVAQACAAYPVSRSFLYERGEALGVAHRPDGTRKIVVLEAQLKAYLDGRRRG